MKLREKMKRFWTLDVHNHEGFTLVELIIVIAILAILSTGAIAGYSAYVERANKTADKALVAEIENALMLAYYSGEITESGYVILSMDTTAEASDDAIEAALLAAYGNLDGLKLKYKWDASNIASYVDSNFSGKESVLLGEVEELTGALALAIKNGLDLGDFGDSLGNYGLNKDSDATAISNAAVLYVAEKTAGKGDAVQSTLEKHMNNILTTGTAGFVDNVFNELSPVVGDVAALAAIYAVAEGYAQYCGADAVKEFHEASDFTVTDGNMNAVKAAAELQAAFNKLGMKYGTNIESYLNDGEGTMDVAGYVGIMESVKDNQGIVMDNLYAEDCFTDGTIENLLATMGEAMASTDEGEISISIIIANGQAFTQVSHTDIEG